MGDYGSVCGDASGLLPLATVLLRGALTVSKQPIKTRHTAKFTTEIITCQVGAPDIFKRMAELGVYADIQPAFVSSDWPIVMPRLGAERSRKSYA